MPALAYLDGLKTLLGDIKYIMNLVYPLIISLAFIYFFWGMGQFILKSGDSKLRDEGKQKMIWGVIALFAILAINGILSGVGNLIGVHPDGTIPGGPSSNSSSSIYGNTLAPGFNNADQYNTP